MKNILVTFAILLSVGFSSTTAVVYAEATGARPFNTEDYTLLEPIPDAKGNINEGSTTISATEYVSRIYYFIFTAAILLAVFMFIIAGIQYTAAGVSPGQKSEATKRMMAALKGLGLALGSYLLLQTVNVDLVKIHLTTPILPGIVGTGGSVGGGGRGNLYGGSHPKPDPEAEATVLQQLKGAYIGVCSSGNGCTKPWCTSDNQTNCTNVSQFPPGTIDRLIGFKQGCDTWLRTNPETRYASCGVVVTGGSEAGHQTHGPGCEIYDIRADDRVSTYLQKSPDATIVTNNFKANGQVGNNTLVRLGNLNYSYEDLGAESHWHVYSDATCGQAQ